MSLKYILQAERGDSFFFFVQRARQELFRLPWRLGRFWVIYRVMR